MPNSNSSPPLPLFRFARSLFPLHDREIHGTKGEVYVKTDMLEIHAYAQRGPRHIRRRFVIHGCVRLQIDLILHGLSHPRAWYTSLHTRVIDSVKRCSPQTSFVHIPYAIILSSSGFHSPCGQDIIQYRSQVVLRHPPAPH